MFFKIMSEFSLCETFLKLVLFLGRTKPILDIFLAEDHDVSATSVVYVIPAPSQINI